MEKEKPMKKENPMEKQKQQTYVMTSHALVVYFRDAVMLVVYVYQ